MRDVSQVTLKVIFDNIRNFMIAAAVVAVGNRYFSATGGSFLSHWAGGTLAFLGAWLMFANALQTVGIFWRLNTEQDPNPVTGPLYPEEVFENLSKIAVARIVLGIIIATSAPAAMLLFFSEQLAKW